MYIMYTVYVFHVLHDHPLKNERPNKCYTFLLKSILYIYIGNARPSLNILFEIHVHDFSELPHQKDDKIQYNY